MQIAPTSPIILGLWQDVHGASTRQDFAKLNRKSRSREQAGDRLGKTFAWGFLCVRNDAGILQIFGFLQKHAI